MVSLFTHGMLALSAVLAMSGVRLCQSMMIPQNVRDFRCGCGCHGRDDDQTHSSLRIGDDDEGGRVQEQTHGREDEQTHSSMRNGGDDDVVEGGDGFLGDRDTDSTSFIAESHDEMENGKEGEGFFQGVGGMEREGLVQVQDKEVMTAAHLLQVIPSARVDLVLRVPDDSREYTDQRQFQGDIHGCGPGLHAQGGWA
ncbi:hypothetical protein Dimus_016509 [Dionaea muscipula]